MEWAKTMNQDQFRRYSYRFCFNGWCFRLGKILGRSPRPFLSRRKPVFFCSAIYEILLHGEWEISWLWQTVNAKVVSKTKSIARVFKKFIESLISASRTMKKWQYQIRFSHWQMTGFSESYSVNCLVEIWAVVCSIWMFHLVADDNLFSQKRPLIFE